MSFFVLLNIYGVILAIVFTVFISFYIIEYTARGGNLLVALRGASKLLFVFAPLSLVVFLYTHHVIWPNQLVWRLYILLLVLYVISLFFVRKYKMARKNLRHKIVSWPVVSSLCLIAFLCLVSPALVILCIYALRI